MVKYHVTVGWDGVYGLHYGCMSCDRVGQCVWFQHEQHQEGGIEGASSGCGGVASDSHGFRSPQGQCNILCGRSGIE